ncbi:conserved hypothetical protein [Neospora caninum Liverpool]|uniref:Transmembrane protein n=1 Tax=Neospora caninum (strain Liverpool) TaxID=572307 RepID=F0VIW9_NEOCL|nr:conserved hypothetical protein [Neospora caninum Liverpool]CBZ53680.1 conserved hypothetical protein [Neospora caninum Liverpool]|eukprot:XP_003883712.1 conserved hypothetical protein [Neospora caninum Liverpool]
MDPSEYSPSSSIVPSDGSGTAEDAAPAPPVPGDVVEPNEKNCAASSKYVEALLYVDLSLSSSVELLSRLAPMMVQLQQGAAEDRLPPGKGEPTHSAADSPNFPPKPSINLRLGYHLFSMGEDPENTRFCLGDGRYCSFPVDEPPQVADLVSGRAVVEETLLQLCVAEYAASGDESNGSGPTNSSGESSTGSQQHLDQYFWSYLDSWCRDCSGGDLRAAAKRANPASGTEEEGHATKVSDKESIDARSAELFLPFDSKCSLKKLRDLGISVEKIGTECKAGDNAENLLQRQIDLHLSRVPVFFINGKEDAPSIMNRSGERGAGGDDDVAVAAHLLKTYGRTPGDPAAASASGGGGGAIAVNDKGVYRMKNVSAIQRLHERLDAHRVEEIDAATAAILFEQEKTAHRDKEQAREPVRSIGAPLHALPMHTPSTSGAPSRAVSVQEGATADRGGPASSSGRAAHQRVPIPNEGQPECDWLLYAGCGALLLVGILCVILCKSFILGSKHTSAQHVARNSAPTPPAVRETFASDWREKKKM